MLSHFPGPPDSSIVSRIIGKPEWLRFVTGFRHDDIATWESSFARLLEDLNTGKLKDSAALGLARQLGINNFVRPSAKHACRFHASQNVRPSAPAIRLKSSLNDDRSAFLHGVERLCDSV